MLTLTTNNATLIHKVPTNFVLDPKQPVQGEDHPSGPQAYAKANQMLYALVTTKSSLTMRCLLQPLPM